MAKDVITMAEAARIYKKITGHRRSPRCIEADVHIFHHLGCFDYGRANVKPKLKGVNRHAWEYFVRVRFLLRGPGQVFSGLDEGES